MTKSPTSRKHTENAIQRHLIHWLKDDYPEIRVLAIRNEDMRHRPDEIEKGHPDLQLELNHNGTTHILKLELKSLKGKINPGAQTKWHENFTPTINCEADIAFGFDKAQERIRQWISNKH